MPKSYVTVHPDDTPEAHAAAWNLSPLCDAYGVPVGTAPGGAIIDIVELGGWSPPQADIDEFCRQNGLPVPSIEVIGAPQPDPGGADVEVSLDVMWSLVYSRATGQSARIRLRFLPNADGSIAQGIADATAAGSDVVSISWGEDEKLTTPAGCQQMEDAAIAAAAAGLAVCAASGDNGSSDGEPGSNVDSPSSCPHVLACGGTRKPHVGEEVAWAGTGGGYSAVFPAQTWQIGAHPGPGRMVPDVAGLAAPATGCRIVVDGKWTIVGGTSAVAPFWAGLIAAHGPKPGWVNPVLWANPATLAEVTKGDNGQYRAGPYPDPLTGLGVPDGAKVLGLKL